MPPKKKKQAKQRQSQDAGSEPEGKASKAKDEGNASKAKDEGERKQPVDDGDSDSDSTENDISYRNYDRHAALKVEWQQQRGAKTSFLC